MCLQRLFYSHQAVTTGMDGSGGFSRISKKQGPFIFLKLTFGFGDGGGVSDPGRKKYGSSIWMGHVSL